MNALVLGGASWNHMIHVDRFPEPVPSTIFAAGSHETVGSSGAGKALNLKHLGWDVGLWAAIGADEHGARIRHHLEERGVALVAVDDPAGTMRHVNLMDARGERISIFVSSNSASVDFDFASTGEAMRSADVVAVTIFDHCRPFLPVARDHGVDLWVDIHDYDGENPYHREFIDAARYLQLSTVSTWDWRGFAESRLDAGTDLVLCTHGAKGASALTADGWVIVEPEPVHPVDTNGAGDAFFAGFVTSWMRDPSPPTALDAGARAARDAVLSPDLAPA